MHFFPFYYFRGGHASYWMHSAMRDVKDMGQQMGYRSLEWNWSMDRPIGAGIVDGAKLFE